MTRADLADITLVVDRSGSMSTCRDEAQGGINAFINDQKKVAGEAVLTILQFDTEYEFVCKAKPIKEADKYELIPRGMTSLLDAVGRAVHETGERLAKMPEEQRPGLVVLAIITDGHENSSHEFTKQHIRSMIERQVNDYQWKFVFLGADAQAFDEAAAIGISAAATAQYDPAKSGQTYAALAANVATSRLCVASGGQADVGWTDAQRDVIA